MRKEILVIDGSKAVRFLLHTILKKHYKVISVPDGLSAMHYLRQGLNPHMIILDPDIADMPDWELVKQLSLNSFYNNIPLVVISSKGENSTKANSMKYSVVEYFTKPFNPSRLVESIDMILVGNNISKA
jgi:DNA-binding NtrC family response regulator